MSTSNLQKQVGYRLSLDFGGYTIRENIRPDWLLSVDGERLELDFLIVELDSAIEVQGQQHYRYTPWMHGNYNGFLKRQRDDKRKKEVCTKYGISLYEVSNLLDLEISIERIKPKTEEPKFIPTVLVVENSSFTREQKNRRQAVRNIKNHIKRLQDEERKGFPQKNLAIRIKRKILETSEKWNIDLNDYFSTWPNRNQK